MFSTTPEEKLRERIKELECLYEIATLTNTKESEIKNTLNLIGLSVKKALQFPEDAVVEILLDHYHILTNELPQDSVCLKAKITSFNKEAGYIQVHYPKPHLTAHHFLKEEVVLLKGVATSIKSFYEKQLNMQREILVKQNAERVDRLSILAEITAGIAHEINTPLGNILGFAELLAEKKMDAESKQDIKKIKSAAIYSREIVKKLMFFSCEMPSRSEFIEVKPIITQVLSFLEHRFNKKSVFYKLILEDDNLKARLDSVQFTQILFNLLLNALYAAPKKSTVTLEISRDSSFLNVFISDEGSGIPDSNKSKVFEPFFTTKPLGEGTGLGLSVVHGIVKAHKGEIIINDNKPQGVIFKIALPLASEL
jgi:two-component system NtrC family sensor kinase